MMDELEAYKRAAAREKQAREEAERLLDEKSRDLYTSVETLEDALHHLQKAQAQLIQSEKMASLGQLAAGVAHEINNPIGYTMSNMESLQDYLSSLWELDSILADDSKSAEERLSLFLQAREDKDYTFIREDCVAILKESREGLVRVRDIVAGLKQVSYKGKKDFSDCQVNDCIHACLKVVENELKYRVEVKLALGELPLIRAQSADLNQVFMNLFVNAAHACEDQGILWIRTRVINDGVEIQVEDNGAGIPADKLSKIFDPFYTSKPLGVGTGLGLSVSHGVIERHGGRIDVTSQEGEGTCFTVSLPFAPPSATDKQGEKRGP